VVPITATLFLFDDDDDDEGTDDIAKGGAREGRSFLVLAVLRLWMGVLAKASTTALELPVLDTSE